MLLTVAQGHVTHECLPQVFSVGESMRSAHIGDAHIESLNQAIGSGKTPGAYRGQWPKTDGAGWSRRASEAVFDIDVEKPSSWLLKAL